MSDPQISVVLAGFLEPCRYVEVYAEVTAAHYFDEFIRAFVRITGFDVQDLVCSVVGIKSVDICIVKDDAVRMVLNDDVGKPSADK